MFDFNKSQIYFKPCFLHDYDKWAEIHTLRLGNYFEITPIAKCIFYPACDVKVSKLSLQPFLIFLKDC